MKYIDVNKTKLKRRFKKELLKIQWPQQQSHQQVSWYNFSHWLAGLRERKKRKGIFAKICFSKRWKWWCQQQTNNIRRRKDKKKNKNHQQPRHRHIQKQEIFKSPIWKHLRRRRRRPSLNDRRGASELAPHQKIKRQKNNESVLSLVGCCFELFHESWD